MLDTILQTLLSELQKISRTETVVGQPIRAGKATLVPISRVQIGFGVGTTGNGGNPNPKFSGSGTGGGLRIEPVACVVLNDDGHAQLLQLTEGGQKPFGKIIDLVPEILGMLGSSEKKNSSTGDEGRRVVSKSIDDNSEPKESDGKRPKNV